MQAYSRGLGAEPSLGCRDNAPGYRAALPPDADGILISDTKTRLKLKR